jgi:hypothetical protein
MSTPARAPPTMAHEESKGGGEDSDWAEEPPRTSLRLAL